MIERGGLKRKTNRDIEKFDREIKTFDGDGGRKIREKQRQTFNGGGDWREKKRERNRDF